MSDGSAWRIDMGDDEKADIARRGVELIEDVERVDLGEIRQHLKDTAKDAAADAVLAGIDALSRLTGKRGATPRTGPTAEQIERTLAAMEAQAVRAFDERLAKAAARARASEAEPERTRGTDLASLKRSFPAESREFATLVFACADLLADLADDDETTPTGEELARKELLIARIGALLAPRAETALASFVSHVVELSRRHRAR